MSDLTDDTLDQFVHLERARLREEIVHFLDESLRIEGIGRGPSPAEIMATMRFHLLPVMTLARLNALQRVYAPGKPLRCKPGMNVWIGGRQSPEGGVTIPRELRAIIERANADADPYRTHVEFELLHPYLDGNGRSDRALWDWQMERQRLDAFRLPFLHRAYYQALAMVAG